VSETTHASPEPRDVEQAPAEQWRPLRIPGRPHGLQGRLVAIEGVDGSGKTTQIGLLERHLRGRGLPFVVVPVPSLELRATTYWRAWADESTGVPPELVDGYGLSVMALGDRVVQQTAVIAPALAAGSVVVCDRYVLSSLVYESSPAHEHVLSRLFAPDAAILLTTGPATVLERLRSRDYELVHSRDESEKPQLIRRYELLAKENGYVFVRTDARSPEDTFAEVLRALERAGALPAPVRRR
jgi:dTMP kinase